MPENLTNALRRCPPLRDAVYRNRTPDRTLRHAVSLACLPFGTFAAVAPWVSAWDVVPAAEACAKVEALHINTRTSSHRESLQILTEAAWIISNSSADADPAPFSKVKTLEITFTSLDDHSGWDELCDAAVREMFHALPLLQHLKLPRPLNMRGRFVGQPRPEHPNSFWVARGSSTLSFGGGPWGRVPLSRALDSLRRHPQLTSLDLCDNTLNMRGVFFTSLLLCRGTVKAVTWNAGCALKEIVSSTGNPSAAPTADDLHLRLVADTPAKFDPEAVAEEDYQRRGIRLIMVAGVPVHWTLEKFVMCNGGVELAVTDLLLLIRMCPRLKELHIASCQSWWFDEPLLLGWGSRRVFLDDDSAAPVIVEDVAFNQSRKPLHGIRHQVLDIMTVAHCVVQELMQTFKADPEILAQYHNVALGRIVAEGTYPAALLWALCRGLEHTSLTSLRLHGSLADGPAEEAAAVIALATRVRRAKKQRKTL